jgi:hypothetical protein
VALPHAARPRTAGGRDDLVAVPPAPAEADKWRNELLDDRFVPRVRRSATARSRNAAERRTGEAIDHMLGLELQAARHGTNRNRRLAGDLVRTLAEVPDVLLLGGLGELLLALAEAPDVLLVRRVREFFLAFAEAPDVLLLGRVGELLLPGAETAL